MDPDRTSPGAVRLGAVVGESGTTFAVRSGGEAVDVCLLDADGWTGERRLAMRRRAHDVWHLHVPGVGPGTRYGYRVDGPWDPWHGHRFNPAKLLVDPYARAIDGALRGDDAACGHSGLDDTARDDRDSAAVVPHSVVVGEVARPTARPRVPWADTVIYELHVRGFTMRHPDVPPELRGTYAGLAHPAVVEHLLALGVTTAELLPVHHHVPEPSLLHRGATNFWGYNTLGFFAPHAAYSSSGTRGEQVHEFAAMVDAMHTAGIEVLLDVVYNHTAEGGSHGPTLSLRGLDNAAYYRPRGGREYEDFTGCGNTVDLRNPAALAMVTDSLRYWVQELGVDGFRFDLAPTLARGSDAFERGGVFLSVMGQDPVLADVKLIAEPWDVGPGGYQLGHFPPPWSEWNDRFRDTVRDCWLASNARKHTSGFRDLAYRASGSSDIFGTPGRGPLSSVNFVTAHDGFTLHDLVSYEHKRNEANGEHNRDGTSDNRGWNCGIEGPTDDDVVLHTRRRMMRNLLATLLTSTGVPMLLAGDETGRTQLGNNNAYAVDGETTWVDWSWTEAMSSGDEDWRLELLSWTRALVHLRREHRVLRREQFFDGNHRADGRADLAWFSPSGEVMTDGEWFDHDRWAIGTYVAAADAGEGSVLVLLNTGGHEQPFALPRGPWATTYRRLLDTAEDRPMASDFDELPGSTVVLAPHSTVVFAATV